MYVVVLKARYLGVAQVSDTTGRQIATNLPVRYWAPYAIKLLDLVEFRDDNGNGIADYGRGYDSLTGNSTWFSEIDTIPKRADLTTTWTRGPIARSGDAGSRMWSFNLTARNLPYEGVNNTVTSRGDDLLNSVRFTFHLMATLEELTNVTLPKWRVTVDTTRPLRPQVTNVTRTDDGTYNGNVARYSLKWDQEIQGWDFDPGGPR